MITKVLVALTTAGLTTALLGAAPGPAQAADCQQTDHPFIQTAVTPASVVIGTKLAKTVAVTASTTIACSTLGLYAPVGDSHSGPGTTLVLREDAANWDWSGRVTITPSDLDNSMAGNVDTTFFAYGVPDEDEVIIERVTNRDLHLYRAARLSVNAAPESVSKGQPLTVTGVLQRANWDEGVYQGYRHRKVTLMFRTTNSSYTAVKSVISGPGGRLKTTVKADQDGYYVWDFAGNSSTASARPAGDYIDVR